MNNVDTSLDAFPVKDLPSRYNIGRTILYERINALEIKLEKQGNRAYVSAEQLGLLDALDNHIKNGGTTPQFLESMGLYGEQGEHLAKHLPIKLFSSEQNGGQSTSKTIVFQLLPPPPDSIDSCERNRRYLREAAEHGDIMPTSELLPLLGLLKLPKHDGKFSRRGFVFTKMESQGKGCEWRISKS